MLYRTHHHPFLFPFNPFTSSVSSSNILSPHPSPSPSSLQVVERGMECVEGALKGSFRPEAAAKTAQNYTQFNQQAFLDDLLAVNGQQTDDFFVDDLLDFSNDIVQPTVEGEEQNHHHQNRQEEDPQQQKQQPNNVNKLCSPQIYNTSAPTNNSDITDDFGSLSVPADDVESLEWLSHFVEDSFSEYSLTYPPGKLQPVKPEETRPEPKTPAQETKVFTSPVTKARTKRARVGLRVWPLGSSSLTESSSTSSSSSTTSTISENVYGVYSNPGQWQTAESIEPQAKKQKKRPGNVSAAGQLPRRCSHCGVQKTPQWRAGPLGAKTLCNACGVRYKSGRLLPEYRPACSPTFSSELHSNNHRKVLEMRRQKEVEESNPA